MLCPLDSFFQGGNALRVSFANSATKSSITQIEQLPNGGTLQTAEVEPQVITNLFDSSREKRRVVRFDDLPPGQYTIQCQSVAFIPCHLDNRVIFVPSEDVRPLDQPLDLGEMELQKN